eukprot:PhM_4_TR8120/c0_g1_i1/m.18191
MNDHRRRRRKYTVAVLVLTMAIVAVTLLSSRTDSFDVAVGAKVVVGDAVVPTSPVMTPTPAKTTMTTTQVNNQIIEIPTTIAACPSTSSSYTSLALLKETELRSDVVQPNADAYANSTDPPEEGAPAASMATSVMDRLQEKMYQSMNDANAPTLSAFERQQVRTKMRLNRIRVDRETRPFNRTNVPRIAAASAAKKRENPFLYFVVTGSNSIRDRVLGLHFTLAAVRDVLWFTDQNSTHPNFRLIQPIVLRNDFEDEVCRREQELVEETQMKGCRYQRSFYRHLAIWRWFRDNPSVWQHKEYFVKMSDDTFVVPHHLEWVVTQATQNAAAGRAPPLFFGKNESRASYWFYSGGHATVLAREAFAVWTRRVDDCEGIVLDHAPKKFRKFWWWADDVLISYCWQHLTSAVDAMRGGGPETTLAHRGGAKDVFAELPGCYSTQRFGEFPHIKQLWECLPAQTPSPTSAPKKRATTDLVPTSSLRPESVLPVSLHTYPYIAPDQMFGLWNLLYGV